MPILLFLSLNSLRFLITYTNLFELNIIQKIFDESFEFKKRNIENKKPTQVFRDTDPKSFSSYRTLHWRNIFNDTKKNFMGHGPMGDRYIIDMSASSLFFYALASLWICCRLIFIILLSLRSAYLICLFYFL